MIIAVDCRPLMGGKLSGVELYTLHLLAHILRIDKQNRYVLFMNASSAQLHHLDRFTQANVFKVQTRIPNKILNFCLFLFKWPRLDQLIIKSLKNEDIKKIDVIFLPDLRPFAVSGKVKTIGVVHDLSFHHFPAFFSIKTRVWHRLLNARKLIKKLDSVITVSNFTKNDIVKTFQIDPEKISAIHEGIENDFCAGIDDQKSAQIRAKYNLPANYFLFLSTLEPRKNLARIIEAFKLYKQNHPDDLKLVLVGKPSNIFSELHIEKHPDIVLTGFVEEGDKKYLFHLAKAFLYPSIFEGFGLPLLEAMKCGTPIITSQTSSMPEVCANAALYVDPLSIAEIAETMHQIQEPETVSKLKSKMVSRIQAFSWDKCAAETLKVITSI